jgi:small subunit ribosomal protein S6
LTEYEILLLLDPDLSEERQTEIVTRIRETVERDGSWDRHDAWGRRKLAYEIDHKPEGFYHLLLFSSSAETLDEITRVLRITDGVLRHLAVRRLKSGSAAEPQAAPARAEEPEAEPAAEPAGEPEAAAMAEATTPAEPTAEPAAEPEVVQEAG